MKRLTLLVVSFIVFFSLSVSPIFAAPPALTLSDAVYADLAIRHLLDNVSLYYADGKTSNNVVVNEERHWIPASTVKTFAAMYAFKLISTGSLHLTDHVTIDAKNNVPTELVTDELPTLLEGQSVTIDRLLRQMITQSDNTAFNQLLDVLGRDSITDYIQSLGLVHSRVGSKLNLDTSQEQYEFDAPGYGINTTTAEDYAKAFALIKNNKIAGAKELFSILKDQKINDMIPLYLPKTIVCGHKTGDLDPLYHDGGICQDKKQSYIVTIFTNAGDPTLLAHLSELVYKKDVNLVGVKLTKQPISEIPEDHPIDPLVLKPVDPSVLGANTANLPVPDITTADLGIKASDLSQVIKKTELPHVVIPADSPFHGISDAWHITKKLFARGPEARRDVDIEAAKLKIAEVQDLFTRGKKQEAQQELVHLQDGLVAMLKDPTITKDSVFQNQIQAVSETRFEILGEQLQQNKSEEEKIAAIKQIATTAKQTIQEIEPQIPDATNASNPAQKPLIGQIVTKTDTSMTVKTAGGQTITVPLNKDIHIEEKQPTEVSSITPSPTDALSPTVTSQSEKTEDKTSLTVGSTVALVGSSTNNTFAPSLIVTNIPKELAAPQPVTVAKIDTKHNTMVVVENGVYTQVNINKDTTIKGSNTNIPLKEIQPGDVVVVHGEPLTPISPTPSLSPTEIVPTSTVPTVLPTTKNEPTTITNVPTITSSDTKISSVPTQIVTTGTVSPTNIPTTKPIVTIKENAVVNNKISPTQSQLTIAPKVTSTSQKVVTPPLQSPAVQKPLPTTSPTQITKPVQQPVQPQPKIIQSTSVQVIEKKDDIQKNQAAPKPTQQSQPQQQAQPQSQSQQKNNDTNQPKSPPPASNTVDTSTNKTDDKKK